MKLNRDNQNYVYSFIGKNIKKYRKQKGWTQAKLAAEANYSKQFISNIENSGIPAACHTGAYHSASSVCPSGPCQVPRTGIFL